MKNLSKYLFAIGAFVCIACSEKQPAIPSESVPVDSVPEIYPDYTDVVVLHSVADRVCDASYLM